MNFRALLASGALLTATIAGAASAQTVTQPSGAGRSTQIAQVYPTPNPYRRGERGGARNIHMVRVRLERLIDQLQNDPHDYGGHRVQAIQYMQQARQQLLLAEQYDLQHPGQ
jgi:hypothetical protein